MLENLLNSIPTPVSLQKLCPWLRNDVVPFVRRVVPEGQVSRLRVPTPVVQFYFLHRIIAR